MKKLFLLVITIGLFIGANAQAMGPEYNTAIGFKFSPSAITFKNFVQQNRAIEVLGYFWSDGFRLTGLYEWHGDFNSANGLKWYAGGGAHLDFWNKKYRDRRENAASVAPGIDGVIGLDYKFNGAPINISLDWQPSLTFASNDNFASNWIGVALRFAF